MKSLLVLFVLCFVLGFVSSAKKDAQPGATPKGTNKDFGFGKDVRLLDGSGAGINTDDEDDFGDNSGDLGFGSGVEEKRTEKVVDSKPVLTDCLKQLMDAQSGRTSVHFYPRCTSNGEYSPIQCSRNDSECWCVTRTGQQVLGTVRRAPHSPDCNRDLPVGPSSTPRYDPPFYFQTSEPSYIVNRDKTRQSHPTSHPMSRGEYGISKQPDLTTDDEFFERRGDDPKKFRLSQTFVGQPGVLAGIIGGTLICLLCTVLLLMFVCYRVRRRDSSADEKSNKVPIIGYTNGHDRDLYA